LNRKISRKEISVGRFYIADKSHYGRRIKLKVNSRNKWDFTKSKVGRSSGVLFLRVGNPAIVDAEKQGRKETDRHKWREMRRE
jgi:hypothetical protein